MNRPKTLNIILLIVGVLLTLTGILGIVLTVLKYRAGIGIIGGADAPTAMFWFQTSGWRELLSIIFGIVCVVISAVRLKKGGQK